jgi:hypothetical protein
VADENDLKKTATKNQQHEKKIWRYIKIVCTFAPAYRQTSFFKVFYQCTVEQ